MKQVRLARNRRLSGRTCALAEIRNKLDELDTVLEDLRLYRTRKRSNADELMKFRRVCRVARVMRPYLEAVLHSS
jgi:hypothetical protein